MWPYHLIISLIVLALGCSSGPSIEERQLIHGTIAYPFVATDPIGRDLPSEKFVIRSVAGEREYVVEIPNGAEDYEIEIPLAELGKDQDTGKPPKTLARPSKTDRELTSHFPRLEKYNTKGAANLDRAFGTGEKGGPRQAPSYTLGLAKINKLYKDKKFEYTLIQINDLLTFYPNSPKLYKMKGTILVKIQNLHLAEKAWRRALELSPNDKRLRKSLEILQKKISSLTTKRMRSSSIQPAQAETQDSSNEQVEPLDAF